MGICPLCYQPIESGHFISKLLGETVHDDCGQAQIEKWNEIIRGSLPS
jgi:hypothetical protein